MIFVLKANMTEIQTQKRFVKATSPSLNNLLGGWSGEKINPNGFIYVYYEHRSPISALKIPEFRFDFCFEDKPDRNPNSKATCRSDFAFA